MISAKGRGTSWTGRQSVEGKTHTHIHTKGKYSISNSTGMSGLSEEIRVHGKVSRGEHSNSTQKGPLAVPTGNQAQDLPAVRPQCYLHAALQQ